MRCFIAAILTVLVVGSSASILGSLTGGLTGSADASASGSGSVASNTEIVGDAVTALNSVLKGLPTDVLSGLTGDMEINDILGNINSLLGSVPAEGPVGDDVVSKLLELLKSLLEALLGKGILDTGSLTGVLGDLPLAGPVTDVVKSVVPGSSGDGGDFNDLLGGLIKGVSSAVDGTPLDGLTGNGISDVLGINDDLNGVVKDLTSSVNDLLSGDLGSLLDGVTGDSGVGDILGNIENVLGSAGDGPLSDGVVGQLVELVKALLKALLGNDLLDLGGVTDILDTLPLTGQITDAVKSVLDDENGSGPLASLQDTLSNLLGGMKDSPGGLDAVGLDDMDLGTDVNSIVKDVNSVLDKVTSDDLSGAINEVLSSLLPDISGLVRSLKEGTGLLSFLNGAPNGVINLNEDFVPGIPSGDLSTVLRGTKDPVNFLFSIDASNAAGMENFQDQIKAAIATAEKVLGDGSNRVRVGAIVNGASRTFVDLTGNFDLFKTTLESIPFLGHTLLPSQALRNSLFGTYMHILQKGLNGPGQDTRLISFINDAPRGIVQDPTALVEAKSIAATLKRLGIETELAQITQGLTSGLSLDSILAAVASPTAAGLPAVFRALDAADLELSSDLLARIVLGAVHVEVQTDSTGTSLIVTDVYGRQYPLRIKFPSRM